MKRIVSFPSFKHSSLILMLALFFAACGSDNPQKKGPKDTAEAFLTALQFGDFDKAKTYCSEGTASNLDMMASVAKIGANPFSDPYTISDVKEDGEYATVTYDQGKETGKVVQLRKDDGKWQVLASKTGGGSSKSTDDDKDDEPKEEKPDPADLYKSFRDGKDAKQTAVAFMEALEFNDYDAAMRYGSQTTNDVLDFQKGMAELDTKNKSREKAIVSKVEDDGEYAKVFYREGKQKREKELKLGKDKNGNWEVIMSKTDFKENEDK